MNARPSAIRTFFAVAFLAFPTVLFGQTSEQYAAMEQKLWAAFECGALAEAAGKIEESSRLYKMGYDQARPCSMLCVLERLMSKLGANCQ
jgi:hypothetical protein